MVLEEIGGVGVLDQGGEPANDLIVKLLYLCALHLAGADLISGAAMIV